MASEMVEQRMAGKPAIWKPDPTPSSPGGRLPPARKPLVAPHRQQDGASSSSAPVTDYDTTYSGIGYAAQCGRFWDLPCGGKARVRAAQLQHRLPCWGYVMEELLPSPRNEATDTRQPAALIRAGHRGLGELRTITDQEELHEGKRVGRKVRWDWPLSPMCLKPGFIAISKIEIPEPEIKGSVHTASHQVAILGDTVWSKPLAPLALGCDLIAHEATFMEGGCLLLYIFCPDVLHLVPDDASA